MRILAFPSHSSVSRRILTRSVKSVLLYSLALVALCLIVPGVYGSGASLPWGYEVDLVSRDGQLQWADIPGSEDCKGTQQSPIDINLADVRPYSPSASGHELEKPQHWFGQHRIHDHPLTQQFERSTEVVIDHDSHTIFVTSKDDPRRPRNILSGAPLPPGAIYKMRALHFHAPAEHLINNIQFPLEMHVVYDLIRPSEENPILIEHAYPTSRGGVVNMTYSRGKTVTPPPTTATAAAVVGYIFQQKDGCKSSILSELRAHIEANKEYQETPQLWRGGSTIPRAERPRVETRMDLSRHLLYPYAYEHDDGACLLHEYDTFLPPMPNPSPDPSVDGKVHLPPARQLTETELPIPHSETPQFKNLRNLHKLKVNMIGLKGSADNAELDPDLPSSESLLEEQNVEEELERLDAGKVYYSPSSEFAQQFELRGVSDQEGKGEGDADSNESAATAKAKAAAQLASEAAAKASREADIKSRISKEAARITAAQRQEAALPPRGQKWEHPHSRAGTVRFGAAFPSFYSYRGSLTTPPCAQVITWLVGATPVAASGEDLQFFWDLLYGNARLAMPVNQRLISNVNVTAASVEHVSEFSARAPYEMAKPTKKSGDASKAGKKSKKQKADKTFRVTNKGAIDSFKSGDVDVPNPDILQNVVRHAPPGAVKSSGKGSATAAAIRREVGALDTPHVAPATGSAGVELTPPALMDLGLDQANNEHDDDERIIHGRLGVRADTKVIALEIVLSVCGFLIFFFILRTALALAYPYVFGRPLPASSALDISLVNMLKELRRDPFRTLIDVVCCYPSRGAFPSAEAHPPTLVSSVLRQRATHSESVDQAGDAASSSALGDNRRRK